MKNTRRRRLSFRATLLRSAVGGLFGLALAFVAGQPAGAQSPDRPNIGLAPLIAAQPLKEVPLGIWVDQVPSNSFVRVRGLPPGASLSVGHSIAPGSWALPLNDLKDLKVTLPATAEGKVDIFVTLLAQDGSVLAETKLTLAVAGPPTPSPEDRRRALAFLQKGNEQLADGLVAPARLLFERAANLGLAEAAMALAATYDPGEPGQPHMREVPPDPKAAKLWYERARALGAREADQRLRRLQAR